MGKVTKALGIVFGIIIIFFGLIVFSISMILPVIFAGPYLILSVIIFVIGAVVIWLGVRSGRKKPAIQ
jgi:hypothetical protein